MKKIHELQPSFLAFSFDDKPKLNKELELLVKSNFKTIHYDITDGNFVIQPPYFGPEFIEDLYLKGFAIHVHFMVADPWKYTNIYLKFPCNIISFHAEAISPFFAYLLLKKIHHKKRKNGLVFKLETDIKKYQKLVKYCDYVTIMGVEPGKGGQKIDIQTTIKQLEIINQIKKKFNPNLQIQLDGGVNEEAVKLTFNLVDSYVSGSYLMKQKNPKSFLDFINKF